MMPKKTRPAYPSEYRRKVVDLLRSGRTIQSLAREFEPCAGAVAAWVKQADLDACARAWCGVSRRGFRT